MKLLSQGFTNTKLAKETSQTTGFLNFILHLSPADLSGRNVCPNASAGCKFACLNTAGRGRFDNIQKARLRKTQYFFKDRQGFMLDLFQDLQAALRKAKREDKTCVVRLNGTSDIPWESIPMIFNDQKPLSLFQLFPEIQFYDYTKSIKRLEKLSKNPINNYHLTFSRSEINDQDCIKALSLGFNVAVVFKSNVPKVFFDRLTIDGDAHDYRFLDKSPRVVALKAKGLAKRDASGFVV